MFVGVLDDSLDMAKDISYIYIKNVYGEEIAEKQKPYKVVDKNSEWFIKGKQPDAVGGNCTRSC
ncbi:NTF2 fold immunity protein [Rahnella selenatireducens]|uniref:NTF2 fold immunity protein n=1 Tax=Rahnella selenatireducens TaxID=3389797 RepID=UPI0039699BD3